MVKAILLAGIALTCATSAGATTFTFDVNHPVVLTAETDYVDYTYATKLLGEVGTSALYDIRVSYFDTDVDAFVQAPPGFGTATTSTTQQQDGTRVQPDYGRGAKFRFTFSTASESKILVSDLTGLRYNDHGPASEVSFSILPEPSTWLFMLSGFGMIGYVLRRRPEVRMHLARM